MNKTNAQPVIVNPVAKPRRRESVQTLSSRRLQQHRRCCMEDNTPKTWSSPEELRLPLDAGHIERARETVADNKGAQWTLAQAIGLLVGENAELKHELARFLFEFNDMATT